MQVASFVCKCCGTALPPEEKTMVRFTAGTIEEFCRDCVNKRKVQRRKKRVTRRFTKEDKKFLAEMGAKLA